MEMFLAELETEEKMVKTLTVSRAKLTEKEVDFPSVEVLSPTRLQSYIDCPKKYHYNYNEKLSNEPEKEVLIDARHLGSLEHLVFELLLKGESDSVEDLVLEKAEQFFPKSIMANSK